MATLCCPINKTRGSPSCKSTHEQKAVASECFLPPCGLPLKSGGVKEGGGWGVERDGGLFLLFFAGLESMCCSKLHSSHLHPRFLQRDSKLFFGSCRIYWGFITQLLRSLLSAFLAEDESDGRGCAALLGQPVSGWDLFTV